MEKAYTVQQLADLSGIPEHCIRGWCHSGQLAYVRNTPKGPYRIAGSDWERCLQRHRVAEQERQERPAKRMHYRSATKRRAADVSDLPGANTFTH